MLVCVLNGLSTGNSARIIITTLVAFCSIFLTVFMAGFERIPRNVHCVDLFVHVFDVQVLHDRLQVLVLGVQALWRCRENVVQREPKFH